MIESRRDGRERRILLEGVYNLRDVGGYPAQEGRRVRWRRLLRSDSLHRLSPAGQRRLVAYGLRTIIDLRRPSEAERAPNVFAASETVDYRSIPLVDNWEQLASDEDGPPGLFRSNRVMLERAQPRIREVMEAIVQPGALPVLLHCTAGKDRTGLIVALLLRLAGVPRPVIVADYALSDRYLRPLWDEFRAQAREEGENPKVFEQYLPSPPAVMAQTLDYLESRYGSAGGYLRAIGLRKVLLDRLREGLLE